MADDDLQTRIRRHSKTLLIFALGLLGLWWIQSFLSPAIVRVDYSEFLEKIDRGEFAHVSISENRVVGRVAAADSEEASSVQALRPPQVDGELVERLRSQGIPYTGRQEADSGFSLIWLVPLVVMAIPFLILMRALRGASSANPMSFGKNKAKLYDEASRIRVSFNDVAGVDEAKSELEEVIDFLRQPDKYRALGAEIPKGVLLVGPPGTGKTLLARAVAGESQVPFFSMSGSSFVEMFVGVGAARVRDLFAQAVERAPCIVFIDEIDAVGRSRGGLGAMGTHDEREQTLNQLLAEMDGFDPQRGVILMAATNRPEVLDKALVRSGRFDRQIVVDRPDLEGRLAILEVHARKVALQSDTELRSVARRTPGMVGADMAKLVNEAALAAARRGSSSVSQQDFDEAVDRVQLGLAKRGRAMNETERRRIAFHEAGHALVAISLEHTDPVHRVSIIPRSIGSLGFTLQLPTEDRYLMTQRELEDQLAVMMGGRVAEQLSCEDVSTGAQNDLERATETARQMVCRFAMGHGSRARTYGEPGGMRFLDQPMQLDARSYSEERARAIDDAIDEILDRAFTRAREILTQRRALLNRLSERLLELETVDASDIERLVARAG